MHHLVGRTFVLILRPLALPQVSRLVLLVAPSVAAFGVRADIARVEAAYNRAIVGHRFDFCVVVMLACANHS